MKCFKSASIARDPASLADHLKARRYDIGLRQRDLARHLGVGASTILNWEHGTTPPEAYWPRLVEFLGYFPGPLPVCLGERLVARRRMLGLARNQAAKRMGVDEGTLARWEKGIWRPSASKWPLIQRFLAGS